MTVAAKINHRETAMPDSRETTTLVALLDWAYRRQRIDADDARALHEVELLAGGSGSSAASVAQNGLLGCTIHSTAHKQRSAHHPDAVIVADCVALLAAPGRWLVEQHARAGTVPDWGQSQHLEPVIQGGRPLVIEVERVEVRYGRGQRHTVTVTYCPLQLWPDDSWVRMQRAEYIRWHRALEVLDALLAGAGLMRWRVEGIGALGAPWA
ncbi:hypothetical protein [Phaeospirillum tilakii]|uniref:SnoaL-like domain-containing protein n=1 Tax=Phaeospirillum tilakii TaxID=741673 RepID=A0ABW5CEI2_9PROT